MKAGVDKLIQWSGLSVYLEHDALVAWNAGGIDAVEGEDVAGVIAVGELDPQRHRQTGGLQREGHHLGGAGPSCFIAEEEVVVGLNDLAAILSGEVERTAAVEVVDQIDAGGR